MVSVPAACVMMEQLAFLQMRSDKGFSVVVDDGVCAISLCKNGAVSIHENEIRQAV